MAGDGSNSEAEPSCLAAAKLLEPAAAGANHVYSILARPALGAREETHRSAWNTSGNCYARHCSSAPQENNRGARSSAPASLV